MHDTTVSEWRKLRSERYQNALHIERMKYFQIFCFFLAGAIIAMVLGSMFWQELQLPVWCRWLVVVIGGLLGLMAMPVVAKS